VISNHVDAYIGDHLRAPGQPAPAQARGR